MSDTTYLDLRSGSPSENGSIREYLPSGPVQGSDSPFLGSDRPCLAKKRARGRPSKGFFTALLRRKMNVPGTVPEWVYWSGRKEGRMGFSPWQARKRALPDTPLRRRGCQATTLKGDMPEWRNTNIRL